MGYKDASGKVIIAAPTPFPEYDSWTRCRCEYSESDVAKALRAIPKQQKRKKQSHRKPRRG